LNKNLPDFYKQINKMLLEEKYTETLNLTIQTIFEIAMGTLYTDENNIGNVEEIQNIFHQKFYEKAKTEEVNIIEIIKEIKDKIKVPAEDEHKDFLNFIINLY